LKTHVDMEIRRSLYEVLKQHLNAKEITLLVGARQVGKTTLLRALMGELTRQRGNVLFFNLDIETDAAYFQSQAAFLQKIHLEWGDAEGYIFIDEIQRKENAGVFLKGLYDMQLPYKWVVTGSGSLELKAKIHESLVGRKRQFELFPVSFREFLHYKTEYRYVDRLREFCHVEPVPLTHLLWEYLNFGGYPRVVTEATVQEKVLILQEIFNSYVEKDIRYLLNIERPESFRQMIRLLAAHTGQNLTLSTLTSQTALSLPTLKRYLWYAERTFSITLLSPFFRNPKKELTKSPQVYFHDLGLRNLALNQVGKIGPPESSGLVFQNFVYLLLRQALPSVGASIHYWRTHDKAEVDFICQIGEELVPVEVKYQALKKPTISRSFRSFLQKYRPQRAYLINLSLRDQLQVGDTRVQTCPYFDFLGPMDGF